MSSGPDNDPSLAQPASLDEVNPYQPPAASLNVSNPDTDDGLFPDASGGKRFANYFIDLVGLLLTGFVIAIPLAILEEFKVIPAWMDSVENMSRFESTIVAIGLGLIYYAGLERLCGRTLGKLVTGTKVISVTGARPTVGQLIMRTLIRNIPFEAVSFLFSGNWHDRWSRTRVVDIRDIASRDAMKKMGPQLARLYRN